VYFGSPTNIVGGMKRISYDRATGNLNFIDGSLASPTTQMAINSSGNVGIGTSSPGVKLEVVQNQATYSYFDYYNTTVNGGINFRQIYRNIANTGNATVDFAKLIGGGFALNNTDDNAANFTSFGVGASERMRITSAGNVGIGTSSPTYQLQVKGLGQDTAALTDAGNKGGSLYLQATANTSGSGGALLFGTTFGNATPFAAIKGLVTDGGTNTTGDLAFSTRNAISDTALTERMRIALNGNVGIGTSAPAYALDVLAGGSSGGIVDVGRFYALAAGAATSRILFGSAANAVCAGIGAQTTTGTSGDLTFYTEAGGSLNENMRLNASGNLGIGTSPSGDRLNVAGNIQATQATYGYLGITSGTVQGQFAANASGNLDIRAVSNHPMVFYTNNTEKARISASGFLQVGTTTEFPGLGNTVGGVSFEPSGSAFFSRNGANIALYVNRGGDGTVVSIRSSGTEVGSISFSGSTTSYNTSSDYRLKDIDGPIVNSGSYIDALNPVQGSWKADGSRFIGLLAHEVQEVSETPIATGEKDGEEMQAMDYSAPELIANLIAEIQSMRARLALLEGN
jgi:hypothetical protein